MVLCNSRYRELYPDLAHIVEPGVSFEHIIRTAAERGVVADAVERPEEWVAQRLAHRDPSGSLLHPQSDGRWIQISERKTQDGGTVGVFTEVTELKRREEELAKANEAKDTALQLLQAALDSIAHGVLFMDADLRIRLANRAYREIWDMPEEFFRDHPSLRQDMEYTRRQGLYQVQDAEWQEYIACRIKEIREGNIPPRELRLANNKVLQYECVALPDGGRMLTYFDITQLKRIQEALRESVERYDLAARLERSTLGLGRGDRRHLISRIQSLCGLPTSASGLTPRMEAMLHPDDLERHRSAIWRTCAARPHSSALSVGYVGPTAPSLDPKSRPRPARWLRAGIPNGRLLRRYHATQGREDQLADAVSGKGQPCEAQTVLDNIEYGLLFMDADLRPRVANAPCTASGDFPRSIITERPSWPEMVDTSATRGCTSAADGRLAGRHGWPSAKRGSAADPEPVELRLSDGTVLQHGAWRSPTAGACSPISTSPS